MNNGNLVTVNYVSSIPKPGTISSTHPGVIVAIYPLQVKIEMQSVEGPMSVTIPKTWIKTVGDTYVASILTV